MARLRRRNDALRLGKEPARLKTFELVHAHRFDQFFPDQGRDDGRHAVVAEPAGMDARGDEIMAQGVHVEQRGLAGHIAVVIGIDAAGQRRAGGGLHADKADFLAFQPVPEERGHDAGKVGAAAAAADNHIGKGADLGQLFFRLQADDGLMKNDMVQHGAEGILGIFPGGSIFQGLADGDAEGAGGVRHVLQHLAAEGGVRAGAGDDFRAIGVHHDLAVRLLVKGDAYHVDLAFQAEFMGGKGKGAAPLPGPGLGGEAFDAFPLVVIGLGHGAVGLVAAGRRDAFVLEIDFRLGAQGRFQGCCPHQRRRAPDTVNFLYFQRDIDPAFIAHLLFQQTHGKDRGQLFRTHRLFGLRIKGRRHAVWDIGHDVIPLGRHFIFIEKNLFLFHGLSLRKYSEMMVRSQNSEFRIQNPLYQVYNRG